MQLLHAVQRKATGAELSAATAPGARTFIPKGPTSVRQFFALSPFEKVINRCTLLWGTYPILCDRFRDTDKLVHEAGPSDRRQHMFRRSADRQLHG